MNIALDAMGGDHAPEAIVAGAVEAARIYGVTVSLVGKPDVVAAELKKHNVRGLDLPIVPATQVIEMDENLLLRCVPNQTARWSSAVNW